MDREQLNKLLEQYDEAQSSLDNERALMKYAKIIGHSISSWSEFVKHQKKVVPAGLQDDLWKAIEQREKRKTKVHPEVDFCCCFSNYYNCIFFDPEP